MEFPGMYSHREPAGVRLGGFRDPERFFWKRCCDVNLEKQNKQKLHDDSFYDCEIFRKLFNYQVYSLALYKLCEGSGQKIWVIFASERLFSADAFFYTHVPAPRIRVVSSLLEFIGLVKQVHRDYTIV